MKEGLYERTTELILWFYAVLMMRNSSKQKLIPEPKKQNRNRRFIDLWFNPGFVLDGVLGFLTEITSSYVNGRIYRLRERIRWLSRVAMIKY